MELIELIAWLNTNCIEYDEFPTDDDHIAIQYWYNNYEMCEAIYDHMGRQIEFNTYTEYGV